MANNSPGNARKSGPLSGLRAIEIGSTVAGPFCARLLADFGAEVIKLEQAEGDMVRTLGSRRDGRSLYAASILRGKRIVSFNLATAEGRELARRLCLTADIVVENLRPGTLERWGLGYDDLAAEDPRLIFVRISGFGQDGPNRDKPGYGPVCEAVSGLREITGDPDRPPARVATSLTDYIAGLYGAFGAVMAVLDRHRTGRGQIVDSALYEGAFSFMEPHIPAFQQLGVIARRAGASLPGSAPNALYPTADGRYVHITALSKSLFERLADLMGQPELVQDPRFATHLTRAEHAAEIDAIISAWTSTQPLAELEPRLEACAIPAARVYDVSDIFADPHFRSRDMLVDVEDPELGPVTVTGIVPKLSENPGAVAWAGRDVGADTRAVLTSVLGLSDEDVDALARDGVVVEPGLRASTAPDVADEQEHAAPTP